MKKSILYLLCSALIGGSTLTSCDGWLGDTEPKDFLTSDQVWNDGSLIEGVLAELYNDVCTNGNLDNDVNFSLIDDFMWCGLMNQDVESYRNQMTEYSYTEFYYYDYAYVYKCNQAIESLATVSQLPQSERDLYTAEFRFLRAYAYFQMCIRMGGVPIITATSTYEPGMDISTLQVPRSTEAETYEFVYNECQDIATTLAANNGVVNHSRAGQWAAKALACRAMLYAGSIKKYDGGSIVKQPEQVGVVGMATGEDASVYYQRAYDVAMEIINGFGGGLGNLQGISNPSDDNFYNAICVKDNNTEVIWTKDYNANKFNSFSFANIAQSMNEDNDNGSDLCPTLQLVETYGKLEDTNPDGTLKVYDNRADIFENIEDVRLRGTCLLPEQEFKGATLDIMAGIAIPDNTNPLGYYLYSASQAGDTYNQNVADNINADYAYLNAVPDNQPLVGNDGPLSRATYTNTGFNLRKYVDETSGSSARGQGSYMWFVYFRLGEVYLNAAEAAMELGRSDALTLVNYVRQRAGAPLWTASDLTIDNMLNERRRELALEDHRFWDMKRLRRAVSTWNGVRSTTTMLYALWPYRIVTGPDAGKYVYYRQIAPRFLAPRNFRLGNYYTAFNQDALDRNPALVENPNQ